MNRNFASLALASAALLAAGTPASAVSPTEGEPFSVRVPTADLDLASEQDRQALRKRMRYMATLTCRSLPGAYAPSSLRACRQAFDDAARAALARTVAANAAP